MANNKRNPKAFKTPTEYDDSDYVVEILDDGTVHAYSMDVCNEVAFKTIEGLMKKEGKVKDFDFLTAMYSIYVNSILILRKGGWGTGELIEELVIRTRELDAEEGLVVGTEIVEWEDGEDDEDGEDEDEV